MKKVSRDAVSTTRFREQAVIFGTATVQKQLSVSIETAGWTKMMHFHVGPLEGAVGRFPAHTLTPLSCEVVRSFKHFSFQGFRRRRGFRDVKAPRRTEQSATGDWKLSTLCVRRGATSLAAVGRPGGLDGPAVSRDRGRSRRPARRADGRAATGCSAQSRYLPSDPAGGGGLADGAKPRLFPIPHADTLSGTAVRSRAGSCTTCTQLGRFDGASPTGLKHFNL